MTVLYSRFPARVVTSDGSEFSRCAVIVFESGAVLAAQVPTSSFSSADAVQVKATLTNPSVTADAGAMVATGEDGQTWKITQGDGCSCSSPLRQWYRTQLAGTTVGT